MPNPFSMFISSCSVLFQLSHWRKNSSVSFLWHGVVGVVVCVCDNFYLTVLGLSFAAHLGLGLNKWATLQEFVLWEETRSNWWAQPLSSLLVESYNINTFSIGRLPPTKQEKTELIWVLSRQCKLVILSHLNLCQEKVTISKNKNKKSFAKCI